MAPKTKVALEKEDHARDAEFMKALHGKSAEAAPGFAAMLAKDRKAKEVAVDEYFKHFDNKSAETETDADREVGLLTPNSNGACSPLEPGADQGIRNLNKTVSSTSGLFHVRCVNHFYLSYYNLATDLYEYGWGQSFHFCRYSVGEPFYQAIARHEHYLAMKIGIQAGMKVLDVGCGVGGPAREIAKFTDAHITGLNNNDYQIERATRYAAKEGLSNQLKFVKGDFMVCDHRTCVTIHKPLLTGAANVLPRQLV
jgi:sterol 24-C-methyltransferase